MVQHAQLVEAGASLTLADAAALTADDIRFPTQPFVAVEKLYGWSVVIDLFHGVNHPVAVHTREAVCSIGPLLQRLAGQMGDAPGVGMELICRVLYDMQQDYFQFLALAAAGTAPIVPTYTKVVELVQTYRASSLSPLPAHWYAMVDCPKTGQGGSKATPPTAPASMRNTESSVAVTNAHADSRLLARYRGSGHPSITALIGGRSLDYPKREGTPICMAWALKGACSTNCKRAHQHVRYSQAVIQATHKFLDDCGVVNPQE
jgi:hypothetical protein